MHFSAKCKSWKQHPVLVSFLLLVLAQVILRIPSFFEPYWYGDEGIYLTIGQAMNRGAVLYKDIIDHKTPLIYFFARVETQLAFRWLLLFAMILASWSFFYFFLTITRRPRLALGVSLLFAILTALPTYEGLIPNGELFVMTFILLGMMLLSKDTAVSKMFAAHPLPSYTHTPVWLLAAGTSLGLAVMTKVPAVFDLAAVFFIGWLYAIDQVLPWSIRVWHWRSTFGKIATQWLWLGVGIALPILLSIGYFWWKQALGEYLDYGLLYNFRYSSEWIPSHLPANLSFISQLPFKASLLITALLGISLIGSKISLPLRFSLGWLLLAVFASLISNRPYPHYFLQLIPPFVLLLGLAVASFRDTASTPLAQQRLSRLAAVGSVIIATLAVVAGHALVMMRPYETVGYYRQFFNLLTDRVSPIEYRNSFNSVMANNYAVAPILQASNDSKVFIWGTNPALFALSQKMPVGRFTVGFHISEFNAQEEVLNQVEAYSPQYIVIMSDVTVPPKLQSFIRKSYHLERSFSHFDLYQRRSSN